MASEDLDHSPKPKPFSISLASSSQKKKSSPSSSTSTTRPTNSAASSSSSKPTPEILPRRPRTFQDHDSDNEDSHQPPVVEEVTGFDREAGGAISAQKRAEQEKQPLVIKVESKNNWQQRPWLRKRGGLNLLPKEVRAQREAEASGIVAADETTEAEGPSMKFGLTLAGELEAAGVDGDVKMAGAGGVEKERKDEDNRVEGQGEAPKRPLTQDEIAMQALIRESKVDGEETTRRSDLVIPGKRKERDEDEYGKEDYGAEDGRFDETKSFRADVASRPDPASLAAYSAIPVEEFGAALLRGMGWKDGEPIGRGKYESSNAKAATKARIPERRPGYLGIGAKELPGKDKAGSGSEIELGTWGKSAMRKAKKPGEGLYTPVLMRNKKTGEMVTQEEFNRLVKAGEERGLKKDGDDSWRERRDRNLQLNGRNKLRDWDRRSERDYDNDSAKGDGYKYRRNGSGTSGDSYRARDKRRRHEDREAGTSDSGLEDRYARDRGSDRDDRDRDRAPARGSDKERDRKNRSSRRSYDDDGDDGHRSRPSSSSSRRDRDAYRDSHRDRNRYSTNDKRDRYDRDDNERSRSRHEKVY
ncbi:pre-mRNA-splicing factor spp2 [Histoplasma capsulatum]|uniref:Pre-mRNA-splicing factor n=1 Tax=Ajellomyces capsulatus TaxID=5037 RepID=A0A8A1M892_AJECA|nr:pre-mRNA-splicing factor spp2 [Histoplasma capsulatum]